MSSPNAKRSASAPSTISHSNFFAHRMLTDQGACSHIHEPETWEDAGDPENGPSISGGPAFDRYQSESHEFIIDPSGRIVAEMPTDWDEVRFFESPEFLAAAGDGAPFDPDHYQRIRKTGEDFQVCYYDEDGPWYHCYGYGWDGEHERAGFFTRSQAEQIAHSFNGARKPWIVSSARVIDRSL